MPDLSERSLAGHEMAWWRTRVEAVRCECADAREEFANVRRLLAQGRAVVAETQAAA